MDLIIIKNNLSLNNDCALQKQSTIYIQQMQNWTFLLQQNKNLIVLLLALFEQPVSSFGILVFYDSLSS